MTDKQKLELIRSECQRLIDQTERDTGREWSDGCGWGSRLVAGHVIDILNIQADAPTIMISRADRKWVEQRANWAEIE